MKEMNVEVGDLTDPNFMNQWIIDATERAMKTGTCYHSHCIPQHKFAYSDDGNRIVNHILKMENLQEEFTDLMERYHLPVILEHANKTPTKGMSGTKLGVEDLSKEAITKINEWAKLDLELLGYEKLDPSSRSDS